MDPTRRRGAPALSVPQVAAAPGAPAARSPEGHRARSGDLGSVHARLDEVGQRAVEGGVLAAPCAPSATSTTSSAAGMSMAVAAIAYPARPPAPEPLACYELRSHSQEVSARLVDPGGESMVATVTSRLGRVHVELTLLHGAWRGQVVAADGSRVQVMIRRGADPQVIVGGMCHELTCDPAERRTLRERVAQSCAAALEARVHELEHGASPHFAAAARSLLELEEGPNRGTFTFLKLLEQHRELSPQEAAAAPLAYVWATSQATQATALSESLERNLVRLRAAAWLAPAARSVISEGLERASAPLAVHDRAALLTATVHAARHAAMHPADASPVATFEAWAFGWERCLRHIVNSDPRGDGRPERQGRAWTQAAAILREHLPQGHAARAVLSAACDGGPPAEEWPARCRRLALALGEVCHILDHGVSPASNAEPRAGEILPQLSLDSAVAPIHVRELTGPLGAQDASWRDVAQGGLANCYHCTAWASAALARPEAVAEAVALLSHGGPPGAEVARTFRVRWHESDDKNDRVPTEVQVDTRMYAGRDGRLLYGADREHQGDAKQTRAWYPVVEKAFAQLRKHSARYGATEWGYATEVFKLIFGTEEAFQIKVAPRPRDTLLKSLRDSLLHSLPVTASTRHEAQDFVNSELVPGHSYAVMGLEDTETEPKVLLLNLHVDEPGAGPRTLYEDVCLLLVADEAQRARTGKTTGLVRVSLNEFKRLFEVIEWVCLPAKVTAESRARAGLPPQTEA